MKTNLKNNIVGKAAFFITVPLLIFLSQINVTCPICHGTGEIVDDNELKNVSIMSVDKRIISSTQDACTGYVVTRAVPIITVQNIGDYDVEGLIKLTLFNIDKDREEATQYLNIKVPKGGISSLELNVFFVFYSADVPTEHLKILVEPAIGGVKDLVCNGTGVIKLNEYFLAGKYDTELTSTVQQVQEFGPDYSHGVPGSPEWMAFYEIS